MHLSDLWFIAIAALWAGYFVLEGFDFGVGILLPFLGRDDTGRRVMINTIGPFWDGNEVWLLTAGGATFAAFPPWYAAMFSAFYLPLLIILVALIIRGVAFEYRGKRDHARWRAGWDAAIFLGSLVPALLWGVAFGNILRGIPIDSRAQFTGNFFTFLNPYALLGGLATLTLFTLHGALFLALKTTGDLRARANLTASVALAVLAAVSLIAALAANLARREGVAFAADFTAIAATTAALFTALYPAVLPSTLGPAYSLTTGNAASAAPTLAVMTVVAAIFLPLVIAYQAWTYWVFRKRVAGPPKPSTPPLPPVPPEPRAPSAPAGPRGAPQVS